MIDFETLNFFIGNFYSTSSGNNISLYTSPQNVRIPKNVETKVGEFFIAVSGSFSIYNSAAVEIGDTLTIKIYDDDGNVVAQQTNSTGTTTIYLTTPNNKHYTVNMIFTPYRTTPSEFWTGFVVSCGSINPRPSGLFVLGNTVS